MDGWSAGIEQLCDEEHDAVLGDWNCEPHVGGSADLVGTLRDPRGAVESMDCPGQTLAEHQQLITVGVAHDDSGTNTSGNRRGRCGGDRAVGRHPIHCRRTIAAAEVSEASRGCTPVVIRAQPTERGTAKCPGIGRRAPTLGAPRVAEDQTACAQVGRGEPFQRPGDLVGRVVVGRDVAPGATVGFLLDRS